MSRFAEGTSVPVDRSIAEIKRVLQNYRAEKLAFFEEPGVAAIAFVREGRAVRIRLPLPDPARFERTERGKKRSLEAGRREYEAACRQSWRCLLLVVKAKLEAVESKITTFDNEFLAYFVLGDGKTIGDRVIPQLEQLGAGALLLGCDPKGDEVHG